MCPNQLIKVRRKAVPKVGPDAITQRPALAALMLQIIGKANELECHLCALIAHLLNSEAFAVGAMLQTIINFRTKLDIITAGIQTKYSGDDADMAFAVLNIVRQASEKRNIVAHYVYATCDELPNDILLIEPEAYFIKFIDYIGKTPRIYDPEDSVPDRNKVWVYKTKDFQNIVKMQETASKGITFVMHYLLFPERKTQMRAALLSEPLIATALSQVQASKEIP